MKLKHDGVEVKDEAGGRRGFLRRGGAAAVGLAVGSTAIKARAAVPKYRWKMVTTWPKNFPGLGVGAERLAKRIGIMSGGRLKIKVYGAGELVPALGVFDAVKRGTAQMSHSASYYWQGKHEACAFFSAVPFGLNAQEMNAWIHYGGGQKLWDEVYGQFGLKAFCAGNSGVQMGGWFKKEINSIKDFKGLKMRMPGLGGKVLAQLGTAVVTLSGGEIFQALERGTIDATEWVGPYNDMAFGLHRAAKLYYWPGWHEPGTTLECIVNSSAYDGLPKDLQEVVRVACQATNEDMLADYTAKNSDALALLTTKHGVKLKRFSPEILRHLGKVSKSVVSDVAAKNPLSQKVYNSFQKFQKKSEDWIKYSEEAYTLARSKYG